MMPRFRERGHRYGVAPVRVETPDGEHTLIYTAIDLLAEGMTPRPLYAVRRRMEQMSPARLGVFLIQWTLYHRLSDRIANTRIVRWLWRRAF